MITFTFSKSSYPSVTLPEGQTPDDNVVLDYIRDNYQVDMKLAWQAEGSEYNNKLSLNIASGNRPIFFTAMITVPFSSWRRTGCWQI